MRDALRISRYNELPNAREQIILHFPAAVDHAEGTEEGSLHGKDGGGRIFVEFSQRAQGGQLTLMTADRPPRGIAIFRHIDLGGDHPILPRHFTAQLPLQGEGHAVHEGFDQVDNVF